jgi:two-component system chemotaxis response regulator CheB
VNPNRRRVLIVDDSVVVRRLLTELLSAEPDIEVIGVAGNASLALVKLEQVNPDVVVLDMEMPGTGGCELLPQIRKGSPELPVIMFRAPNAAGSRAAIVQAAKEQVLPRIRAVVVHSARAKEATQAEPVRRISREFDAHHVDVVAIGASTGGPNALADLFARIPASFPVPIVLVQHMPSFFTKLLADRLSASCPLSFTEASHGDVLEPGRVWVAPGGLHMRLERTGSDVTIALDMGLPVNSCRPSVDTLFQSVSATFGGRSLGVILTGMGQDGLRGCEHLHACGAEIVAQDEATSVVWSMPGSVVRAGLAQTVLPLPKIAAEIVRRVQRNRSWSVHHTDPPAGDGRDVG